MSDVKKVTAAFERFVKSGYKPKLFTEELYAVFRSSFGFIAHYGRSGFYGVRFSTPAVRVETFRMMSKKTLWPPRPVEQALRDVVIRLDLYAQAVKQEAEEIEREERVELARLKKKYEGSAKK